MRYGATRLAGRVHLAAAETTDDDGSHVHVWHGAVTDESPNFRQRAVATTCLSAAATGLFGGIQIRKLVVSTLFMIIHDLSTGS